MEHFSKPDNSTNQELISTKTEAQEKVETIIEGVNEQALFDIFLDEAAKADAVKSITDGYIPLTEINIEKSDESTNVCGTYVNGNISIYTDTLWKVAEFSFLKKIDAEIAQHDEINAFHETLSETQTDELYDKIKELEREICILGAKKEISDKLLEMYDNKEALVEAFFTAQTISTLIHEELHAISTEAWKSKEIFHQENTENPYSSIMTDYSSVLKSGLARGSVRIKETYEDYHRGKDGSTTNKSFDGVNEGITQLLTTKLSTRYLLENPPNGVHRNMVNWILDPRITSYPNEMKIAEMYIAVIAALSDVPDEVVENALYRTYLNAEDFIPEELAHVPDQYGEVGAELLLKLQIALSDDRFSQESEIYRVMEDLIKKLPESVRDRIKDRFGELFAKYNPVIDLEKESSAEVVAQ